MATTLPQSAADEIRRDVRRFDPHQYRSFANLAEAFHYNARLNFDLVAYDQAEGSPASELQPRVYLPTLQSATQERVLKVAAQLEAWGVKRGDTVAILSLNRPEWTEAEMAAYTVGAVVVALYVRVSRDRLEHMLRDSQARCAVVENEEQLEALCTACPDGCPIANVLSIEDLPLPATTTAGIGVTTLRQVLREQPIREETTFGFVHTKRDDLASVFYTSGSSGMPMGVPVTHGESLENLHQIVAARLVDYSLYDGPDAPTTQPFVTLLLPERAHAFPARTTQLVATSPARARYSTVIDHQSSQISAKYRESIRRDLREGAAGLVPIVPKILVAIEQRVRDRLAHGGFAERLAQFVVENATQKLQNDLQRKQDTAISMLYRLLAPLRKRVAAKIRNQVVGPQFEFFISGGAKLPLETAAFLWAIGIPVHEGYGSTESNCPVATNTPFEHRLGSVGRLFDGVEMRIDPANRELLLRGPNIVRRYWHSANERQSTWTDDGWYRTRDVARQDADGFLYIEDRVDNMLVLWNGENVSASAVEQRFRSVPYVDTAVVIGHQRPVLIALLTLNEDMIRLWAERNNHQLASNWMEDRAVIQLLHEQIEQHVNSGAGHPCERIRQVTVIEPLATEKQTLTATEKVRRREVERRYAALIERLYQNEQDWFPARGSHPITSGLAPVA